MLLVNAVLAAALALAQQGGTGDADRNERIRLLSESLRAEPGSARKAYLLGKALDSAGRYQEAWDAYRRAAVSSTEATPRALALYQQARMALVLGRSEEAALLAATSLAARPTTEARDLQQYLSHAGRPLGAASISRALVLGPEAGPVTAAPGLDLAIEFEFGADYMTEAGLSQAAELAAALSRPELAGARLLVIGHTDSRGNDAVNLALSERRAGAVVAYLIAHGVERARLRAEGHGSREPRSSGNTDEDYRMNRRVEVRVVGR